MTSNITWTDCQIITETFKIVDNHHIKADIVLPPNLKPGKHPLLIAYHGGYLIGGARNCYAAIGPWVPAYAASTSAIILAPDYRLFPSASTADVLSDLEDLWQWIHSTLPDVLSVKAPGHEVDLQKILVEGHSAGGFCAAHLSISHAESIRASILVYPMVDPFSPGVSGKPVEAMVTGAPLTGEELEKKIEAVRQEGWVTERVDSDGWLLMLSLLDGGKFGECFGDNKDHSPVNRVRGMKRPLPRTWILHGKEDRGVPAQWSINFAKEVSKSEVQSDLVLDIIDDEPSDHGFDGSWTMNDEKLTKRLSWIDEVWLR